MGFPGSAIAEIIDNFAVRARSRKRMEIMALKRQKQKSVVKGRRWSQRVTETSDALDLDKGVFSLGSPRAIARSLKRSAERSRRRKSGSLRSAMSMLTFYINRAGRKLSKTRRARLESAKKELRLLYRK
jgi:Protein of unknown function (DUF3175)